MKHSALIICLTFLAVTALGRFASDTFAENVALLEYITSVMNSGCDVKDNSSDRERVNCWKKERVDPDSLEWGPEFKAGQAFLKKLKPDDQVFHFKSPPVTWEKMMGREGYAIYRNGELAEWVFTRLN